MTQKRTANLPAAIELMELGIGLKVFSQLLILLALLLFIFGSWAIAEQVKKEQIKIGVIAPLTGGLARRGADIANLIEMLEPRLNSVSKKYEYRFIIDDGKCGNGNSATTIAAKFISVDKIKFIVTGCSGETLQVAPLAQRSKVIVFAVLSTHQDVKNLGDYVFRTFVDIEVGVKAFADYMARKSGGKIAVLTEENAFTFGIKELLLNYLGKHVAFADDFPADSSDFNTLLTKVKAKNARGVYFNVMSEGTLATLVNQARAMKLTQQFYSYNMPEILSFREATGHNSDGLEFIGTPEIKHASDDFNEVLSEYLNKHSEGPSYEFVVRTTYDAIKSITDAIEAVGPDPSQVRDFLAVYKSKGALGTIEYDENGDIKEINYMLRKMMEDGTNKVLGPLVK